MDMYIYIYYKLIFTPAFTQSYIHTSKKNQIFLPSGNFYELFTQLVGYNYRFLIVNILKDILKTKTEIVICTSVKLLYS